MSRDVHIQDPFWLSSLDNLEADFLSHQALVAWDFQLSRQNFQQVCCHFQVMPTLDTFATSRMNLLPRYMTWERDESMVGQNYLNFHWDPVTAVSTGPPSSSCTAGSGGAEDRGDSNLPMLGTGFVVASSLQDVATAHSGGFQPRIQQVGRIQYGPIYGSPYQGRLVIESDNAVVLNQEDFKFLSHHITTNTTQK